jgi:hypothetical protein
MSGLDRALRSDLLTGGALLPSIAAELRQGGVCVIRDALDVELANAIHGCLDRLDEWEKIEVFKQPYTSYKHLGLLDPGRFPEPVARFAGLFDHASSRRLMAEASGADTSGPTELYVSYFPPGCYQLPHTDFGGGNNVSFVWNLTKDWNASWGGHFFWCSPPTNIVPTFNTLVLFRPSPLSYHFTCPVAPQAEGKRLAITGWWTGVVPAQAAPPPATGWYRGALRDLGSGIFAL